MIDWEKVDRVTDGLKRHTMNVRGESFSPCDGCPYDSDNTTSCTGKLNQDALDVIVEMTTALNNWEKFTGFLAIHNAL